MAWTHDGYPNEEEGVTTFAVMEGRLAISFPKEIIYPVFKLVYVVVETTCSRGFPPFIVFVGEHGIDERV